MLNDEELKIISNGEKLLDTSDKLIECKSRKLNICYEINDWFRAVIESIKNGDIIMEDYQDFYESYLEILTKFMKGP